MDWSIYGALILGTIALAAGTAFVVVRALRAWRDFKRLRRQLAKSLQALADSADATSRTAERVVGDQTALESSLARLRVGLARFNVLLAAVDEVDDTLRRVTAVYPRK
jgi:uncharacterized membrane protein YcjF (UPF0283 family)